MKDEERKPDEQEAEAGGPERSGALESDEAAARAKRVVFKIVPANPKNTFNFEDVADK